MLIIEMADNRQDSPPYQADLQFTRRT